MRAQRERMTDALERRNTDVDDAARDDPHGEWKWAIRKRIWDRMEDTNVAQFPRPVHHRIPNFVNADKAAANLTALQCFKDAECVKVNPDTPQKAVRRAVLEAGKTLMTPQPRLRTGFFSILSEELVPAIAADAEVLKKCCTSAGVASHGVPLSLDEMRDGRKCDLLVIGSCAVDVRSGARLGKGEGFAELEYAIMRMMGTIDESTLVVTTRFPLPVFVAVTSSFELVEDSCMAPAALDRRRPRVRGDPAGLLLSLGLLLVSLDSNATGSVCVDFS